MESIKKSIKYLLVILIILLSIVNSINFNSSIVYAEDDEEKKKVEDKVPEEPLYGATSGIYKDEKVYYSLDLVTPSQIEEKGFLNSIWEKITFDIEDKFVDGYYYSYFFLIQFGFQFNLFMTNVMIGVLNSAYDTNIINALVDKVDDTIKSIAGISNGKFNSKGLFGGFLGIITVTVAIYTLYQVVVKRASISAFSGLLKSLVALTVSLWFFTNYPTIIKGLNTITVQASGLILSGSMKVEKNGNINDVTIKEKMNDNIFNVFVHKPYLMLQYGTIDQSKIGNDRVLSLLSKKPDSDKRKEIAIQEVTEKGNQMLTYTYLQKRMNFLSVMTIANAISSIPVFLLAICLYLFQFWFLVIAMIAPFALLWSAVPNQFGVLKRYFFELSVPLVLKMGVSALALVIFGLTEVIYSINAGSNGTTLSYILSSLIQGLLLLTMFLLRKRIFSIFVIGSSIIKNMRDELNVSVPDPIGKGVQSVTTMAGTLIGGLTGRSKGALVGASIGSNVGNLVTGETGVGDFAQKMGSDIYLAKKMSSNKGAGLDNKVASLEDYKAQKDQQLKQSNLIDNQNSSIDDKKNVNIEDSASSKEEGNAENQSNQESNIRDMVLEKELSESEKEASNNEMLDIKNNSTGAEDNDDGNDSRKNLKDLLNDEINDKEAVVNDYLNNELNYDDDKESENDKVLEEEVKRLNDDNDNEPITQDSLKNAVLENLDGNDLLNESIDPQDGFNNNNLQSESPEKKENILEKHPLDDRQNLIDDIEGKEPIDQDRTMAGNALNSESMTDKAVENNRILDDSSLDSKPLMNTKETKNEGMSKGDSSNSPFLVNKENERVSPQNTLKNEPLIKGTENDRILAGNSLNSSPTKKTGMEKERTLKGASLNNQSLTTNKGTGSNKQKLRGSSLSSNTLDSNDMAQRPTINNSIKGSTLESKKIKPDHKLTGASLGNTKGDTNSKKMDYKQTVTEKNSSDMKNYIADGLNAKNQVGNRPREVKDIILDVFKKKNNK